MESDQPNTENETELQQKLHYTGPPSEGIKIAAIEAAIAAGMAPSTSRVAQSEPAHEPEVHLQDWTDPPTGAVPKILLSDHDEDDEFMKMPTPIWREKGADWQSGQDLGLEFVSEQEQNSFVADGVRSMASMPADIDFDEIDLLAMPSDRYDNAPLLDAGVSFDDGVEFPDFIDSNQYASRDYPEPPESTSGFVLPHFDYVTDEVEEDEEESKAVSGNDATEGSFADGTLSLDHDSKEEDPFAKLEEDFFLLRKFKKKKIRDSKILSEQDPNDNLNTLGIKALRNKERKLPVEEKAVRKQSALFAQAPNKSFGYPKSVSVNRHPKPRQVARVDGEVLSTEGKIAKRNPLTATLTGLILGGIVIGCFELGAQACLALIVILAVLASGELLRSMKHAGHHPAAVLALVATIGLVFGAYFRQLEALVLILALTVICGLIWYMFASDGEKPTIDLSMTLLVVAWVGGLASFGALLLSPSTFPHRTGVAFFASAIILAAANDVGAYAVGALFGKHLLAPKISPHKSLEGFLGGTALTFVFAALVVSAIHPLDMGKALVFALFVVVLAPLGDFAESLIKRDLNVKDMGSILPAHGGILDRVDGILFVLPAIYYLVEAFHLV